MDFGKDSRDILIFDTKWSSLALLVADVASGFTTSNQTSPSSQCTEAINRFISLSFSSRQVFSMEWKHKTRGKGKSWNLQSSNLTHIIHTCVHSSSKAMSLHVFRPHGSLSMQEDWHDTPRSADLTKSKLWQNLQNPKSKIKTDAFGAAKSRTETKPIQNPRSDFFIQTWIWIVGVPTRTRSKWVLDGVLFPRFYEVFRK